MSGWFHDDLDHDRDVAGRAATRGGAARTRDAILGPTAEERYAAHVASACAVLAATLPDAARRREVRARWDAVDTRDWSRSARRTHTAGMHAELACIPLPPTVWSGSRQVPDGHVLLLHGATAVEYHHPSTPDRADLRLTGGWAEAAERVIALAWPPVPAPVVVAPASTAAPASAVPGAVATEGPEVTDSDTLDRIYALAAEDAAEEVTIDGVTYRAGWGDDDDRENPVMHWFRVP